MQLSIDTDTNDASVQHVLSLLHPLVTEQYEIANQNQLIEGLKELQISEAEEDDFMSEEF